MNMNFEAIIDKVISVEKGYVDHPSDRGGPTNYGITIATARKYGYQGDMIDMPLSFAREVYRIRYIVAPSFDKVCEIDAPVGMELIDTGINMGPGRATIFFQEWLNGLNKQGSHYADVYVDGRIGSVTLDAFRAYLRFRGAAGRDVMLYALNCTQGARYLDITQNNESQEDFLFGWMLKRVVEQLKGHEACANQSSTASC